MFEEEGGSGAGADEGAASDEAHRAESVGKPLIFISHKHADAHIARVLANWIDDVTGGHVDVFLSSDSEFETPEIGADLDTELGRNLQRAGVVILLYTSDDHDWSYCTWECGVALNPGAADTRIVCIQCLADSPTILKSTLRVQAASEESVVAFARMFREPRFFPSVEQPASGLNDSRIVEKGEQLHRDLNARLPDAPLENWSAWPYLRLEFPVIVIDALYEPEDADAQIEEAHRVLTDVGRVLSWSASTPGFFGKQEILEGSSFGDLVANWRRLMPGSSGDWLYTLAQQLVDGCSRNAPRIREWARFRPVDGRAEFVVAVGRIKRASTSMVVDCYFFRLVDIETAENRMNRLDNMYYKEASDLETDRVSLVDLVAEMAELRRSRLPILRGERAQYVIHGSMIDRFIRERVLVGEDVRQLTLADLLGEPAMNALFSSSFVVVEGDATIAEAAARMRRVEGCQDVFVTDTGTADGRVIGWLADRDLIESE